MRSTARRFAASPDEPRRTTVPLSIELHDSFPAEELRSTLATVGQVLRDMDTRTSTIAELLSALTQAVRTLRPTPPLMDETEAARYLGGLSPVTLSHWRFERRGPDYAKVGGSVMYRQADLDAFIASVTVRPRSKTAPPPTPPRAHNLLSGPPDQPKTPPGRARRAGDLSRAGNLS